MVNYMILHIFFLQPPQSAATKTAEFYSKPESAGSKPKRQPPDRFKPATPAGTPQPARNSGSRSISQPRASPQMIRIHCKPGAAFATPRSQPPDTSGASFRQPYGGPAGPARLPPAASDCRPARTQPETAPPAPSRAPAARHARTASCEPAGIPTPSARRKAASRRSSRSRKPQARQQARNATASNNKGGAPGTAFCIFRNRTRVRPVPACPFRWPVRASSSAASQRRAPRSAGCARG